MPGLAAAIGANPYLYLVAERIGRRTFGPADAMALIRYSDLTRLTTRAHPGVHVSITAPARARDFHIQGTTYANRVRHSMFRSEDETAQAVANALNTQAGAETILRLQNLRLGGRGVLYSRSGAVPDSGVTRSAGSSGVTWAEARTGFVTLVLDHHGDGLLVLQTAYPNLEPLEDHSVVPPDGADLLEMPRRRYAVFWHSIRP
ncbi:MAG: hypothetical protein U0Q18_15675 [Bryobacteraceae bacterium]